MHPNFYLRAITNFTLREILESDNPKLAAIVRDTLIEFGANHHNKVYFAPSTDTLFMVF